MTDLGNSVGAPATIYVTFAGEHGKQRLVVSVGDMAGNFLPNATVLVIDGEDVRSLRTTANGTVTYQMHFTEESRYVEVRAGATESLVWQARLNGPLPARS